jgi:hypothetical protein
MVVETAGMSLAFASTPLAPGEFSRRREDARRAGSPAWLWPEVPVEKWTEAMAQVAKAAADVLAGRTAQIAGCDPMALSLACYTSGAGPLLGWWAAEGKLGASPEFSQLLALHLSQGRARAERTLPRSLEIVSALVECGVPVAVLKGGHTAHSYFPDPAARPASDLDLLVPKDSAAQSEVALARLGLECAGRHRRESSWVSPDAQREPQSLWLIHADDPWSVDLHSSLDFSATPGASLVRFDMAEPIETSEPWPLDDSAGVLGQPLLLLHLAAHASGGLHSLTLLRMIELVLVVRHDVANGRLSWDEFLHLGALTNALGAAFPALAMAEQLAPGTIPSHVLEICAELAPPRARALAGKLDPAIAHRVDRASITEHFMWVSGASGWARQIASDLAPGSDFWPIYQARAYRLLRGRVSR